MLTWISKSTNINSSISVSISINISDNTLCYDESAKPMFMNSPCVYKQIWALYWEIDWCPKAVFVNTPSVYKHISPNPFPKFLISQMPPVHVAKHNLGNWEMARGTYFPISQFPKRPQPRWASTIWEIGKLGNGYRYIFPNFPNDPAHLAQHYLGNWEIGKWLQVHMSQFPKRPQPIWLSTIWGIGKWLEVHTSQFPNFPKDPS